MNRIPLPDRSLKCLHLGDSYTIGEGVEINESWPFQLRDLLVHQGRSIREQQVLAQTGWTTADLLGAMERAEHQATWDFITPCIGVNNQYQGLELDAYHRELDLLVEKSTTLLVDSSAQAILFSIPDWSVSPFAKDRNHQTIAKEIDGFNKVAREIADLRKIQFIDWTSLSREFSGKDGAFTNDGLHPSGKQYGIWANFVAGVLSS